MKIFKRTLTEAVEKILTLKPKARDNDKLLVAYLWAHLAKKNNVDTLPEFFNMMVKGSLPNHDTVTRIRRKLQETRPELRGTKYKSRQGVLQDTAKEEIKHVH